jgi:hypothetical protein
VKVAYAGFLGVVQGCRSCVAAERGGMAPTKHATPNSYFPHKPVRALLVQFKIPQII